MSKRVINDPSALGWEFDATTGRWTWSGDGSSSGGGGGADYEYWRLQADGGAAYNVTSKEAISFEGTGGITVTRSGSYMTIDGSGVSGGGGGGNYDNYVYWRYEVDGTDTTSVMTMNTVNFRAGANVTLTKTPDGIEIAAAGGSGSGGGGGNDPRITDTQISNWDDAYGWGNHASQGYLTSSSLAPYATQQWVGTNYQPKGNYLTSFTESDPVFKASPAGSISQADINKWNNPPAGGGTDTWDDTLKRNAKTLQNPSAPNYYAVSNTYTLGGVDGAGARIISFDGQFNFYNSGNGTTCTISTTGSITATGDVTAFSDERLKEDIKTLDGSKVYDMRGVSFTKDGRDGSGVIAQELLEVAPELVHDEGEYLSVAYGNLVGYLIEAVKDLKAEVEELKRGGR